MPATKAEIIARLQQDILPLQGFRPKLSSPAVDLALGPMKQAFPNAVFPLGVVHEFICKGIEEEAATDGFIAGILSGLMRKGGVVLWIGAYKMLYPPALKAYGIPPDKIIFIDAQQEMELMWVMEEALRCEGLAAVIGELRELSFTASRRLQLAVEQSKVTGFIIRRDPRSVGTTACVTRWRISPLPSALPEGMPGVGHPCWKVSLLKVRNGRPGVWDMEWSAGRFRHLPAAKTSPREVQKQAG
ncbi:Error-prone repair protein ImuA [Chitinophaga sedimenti]|uniref:ImuA family protein n=1 Tax=Chitinophaga sedimenti TaxID=2033606 RepID=UPI002002AF65|nr:Error-prone repair protein ImuA [Chitinophaga sedimenti]MCK7556335.1 Error-prone repair protein ImuA [Chitinophaga sedimenti]